MHSPTHPPHTHTRPHCCGVSHVPSRAWSGPRAESLLQPAASQMLACPEARASGPRSKSGNWGQFGVPHQLQPSVHTHCKPLACVDTQGLYLCGFFGLLLSQEEGYHMCSGSTILILSPLIRLSGGGNLGDKMCHQQCDVRHLLWDPTQSFLTLNSASSPCYCILTLLHPF